MKRREFITLLGGSAIAWPLGARGQEPGRTYRLGVLSQALREEARYVAFIDELGRLGFIEGQNLSVDGQGFGLRPDQFAQHAAEQVKAKVDVIVCPGEVAIRAAQQATAAIPILGVSADMVDSGLVRSLANPGGNTTGVSILATELDGKRQSLLIELLAGARRIAALSDSSMAAARQLQALEDAARSRGVELTVHAVGKPDEIAPAIDAAKAAGASGLNVLASPLLNANRRIIIERTAVIGLPAIYQWPETAEEGGLAAYGPRFVQLYREQMARLLVKLLRGVKPADLPVEQPTRFELVINMKTANSLGLAIPPLMLAQADGLIE